MVAAEGFEPASDDSEDRAESQQNSANSTQFSALARPPKSTDKQKSALPLQNPGTSVHEKCVPSVHRDHDLREVIEAWSELSDKVRARISEIVKESK